MNIIESNLQFKSNMSQGNIPIMNVLHHSEASHCTIEDIHQWHLDNGWAGCGYHFLVRKDGTIYRGRPENVIGAHCPGANDKSIGICAEGSYMSETMPEVQKQAIIDLCKYTMDKYGFKQIYGHKELYSTDCPGTNYPLSDIKAKSLSKEQVSPNGYRVITGVFNTKQLALDYSDKLKSQGTTAYVVDASILK